MTREEEIIERTQEFLDSFRLVFDYDWDFTKGTLGIEDDNLYIAPDGTFVEPKVDDESNNWANRGGLLSSYRGLVELLPERKPVV